jgi:hypothetical protein
MAREKSSDKDFGYRPLECCFEWEQGSRHCCWQGLQMRRIRDPDRHGRSGSH